MHIGVTVRNMGDQSTPAVMGACAAGVVLGAKVPILLTSRADPPPARLASAALAVIVDNAENAPG